MATPNYNFEKRQRELAKKKKKEDKLKERATRKTDPAVDMDTLQEPLESKHTQINPTA